jgi:hypothetical protein
VLILYSSKTKLQFVHGGGCYSNVGRIPEQDNQPVSIGEGCEHVSVVGVVGCTLCLSKYPFFSFSYFMAFRFLLGSHHSSFPFSSSYFIYITQFPLLPPSFVNYAVSSSALPATKWPTHLAFSIHNPAGTGTSL